MHREPDFVMYADGGTIGGSPGSRGIYWSVKSEQGLSSCGTDETGRRRRSDEAEYTALITSLQLLLRYTHGGELATIHMDCRPVVRSIRLYQKPRPARCRDLYWAAIELMSRLHERDVHVVVSWVPRARMVEVLGH
jgi:ribonuclease HI